MLKLVDKKSTYESGKIDSLYRIGDKLIELKNKPKESKCKVPWVSILITQMP